eukprot:gene27592-34336_t
MTPWIATLESFMAISSSLVVGIALIARAVNGDCVKLDQEHMWGCNSEFAAHALPQEHVMLLMFIPIMYSIVFKAIRLILLLENQRQNLILFFLNQRQNELLGENKVLSDEAQNELRHMIANVAHDLKTPLSAFMSGVETMSGQLNDIGKRYFDSQHIKGLTPKEGIPPSNHKGQSSTFSEDFDGEIQKKKRLEQQVLSPLASLKKLHEQQLSVTPPGEVESMRRLSMNTRSPERYSYMDRLRIKGNMIQSRSRNNSEDLHVEELGAETSPKAGQLSPKQTDSPRISRMATLNASHSYSLLNSSKISPSMDAHDRVVSKYQMLPEMALSTTQPQDEYSAAVMPGSASVGNIVELEGSPRAPPGNLNGVTPSAPFVTVSKPALETPRLSYRSKLSLGVFATESEGRNDDELLRTAFPNIQLYVNFMTKITPKGRAFVQDILCVPDVVIDHTQSVQLSEEQIADPPFALHSEQRRPLEESGRATDLEREKAAMTMERKMKTQKRDTRQTSHLVAGPPITAHQSAYIGDLNRYFTSKKLDFSISHEYHMDLCAEGRVPVHFAVYSNKQARGNAKQLLAYVRIDDPDTADSENMFCANSVSSADSGEEEFHHGAQVIELHTEVMANRSRAMRRIAGLVAAAGESR